MKKIVQLTLGIMAALGGFVDLGQIVFAMQAGARFGYALLWSIVLGGVAIIVYMEMCGRIAAVAQQPVFGVVRTTLDKRLGIATLVGSNLLNLITCAAELGAVAIILHLLFGVPERLALVGGALLLGVLVWLLNFQWIERTFGLAGLAMLVFGVATWKYGIFSAMLMEYEVHFYPSGAIEKEWTANDLPQNSIVAFTGVVLGSLLTCALLILGAIVFLPRSIVPNLLPTMALPVAVPLGPTAVHIVLVGILACVASAAVETALSGGYNLCQFFGLKWNKNLPPKEAPVFTGTWVAMLLLALVLAMTGIKPLTLVNVSIIFGMLIMPLTYYPILKAAGDRALMGEHVTGTVQQMLGWVFFGIIVIAALAAFPLMILTHGGQFASVR